MSNAANTSCQLSARKPCWRWMAIPIWVMIILPAAFCFAKHQYNRPLPFVHQLSYVSKDELPPPRGNGETSND